MGTEPALRCTGLRVEYAGVTALDGVELSVARGELVGLLGASGSGKSTLLHAVAGLVEPCAGEIAVAGRQVCDGAQGVPPERRDVGLVFQEFALWPHLSALDTVAYPLRRAGLGRGPARSAAQRLLDLLDIGELAARRPSELSGGQQQRVGLARALARRPAVFLLDEPTAHLDTHLRAAFQQCVRDRLAGAGAAAVYATHDAGEALALADRVALIVAGRIVQVGSPETVYAEPVSAATARLTGAGTVLPGRVRAAGSGELLLDLGAGEVTVAGAGVTADRLHQREVLLRPEWVRFGGPFRGCVGARGFAGAHTDYRLDTALGTVQVRAPGPPARAVGEQVSWGVEHAWVLPGAERAAVQPSAVIAPG